MVAMLECCKVCSVNTHIGTERAPYTKLSGPMEPIQGWRLQFPEMLHYQWQDVGSPLWPGVKMNSPWSGDMNSPMNKKFKMRVKWCALHFGSGIGWYCWISRNLGKPSTLTSTLRLWLRWGLKLPKSGQRRQLFSYNTITSVPIPVWWPWSTLQVLSGLPYHTHHTVWNWHLLISMFLGRLKMDVMGKIFLATTPL